MGDVYSTDELEEHGLVYTTAVDQQGYKIYRRNQDELFLLEELVGGFYRVHRAYRSRKKRLPVEP
jgi:hypothetical protein